MLSSCENKTKINISRDDLVSGSITNCGCDDTDCAWRDILSRCINIVRNILRYL